MKIYAIVTKNGTLDKIKEFVNPYKNHALSEKLVKTKEKWIKKSKFKNFYKIEKNVLFLKINSDLGNFLFFLKKSSTQIPKLIYCVSNQNNYYVNNQIHYCVNKPLDCG